MDMRKIFLVPLLLVSTLSWATPGQDWLGKSYDQKMLDTDGFTIAYCNMMDRVVPLEDATTMTLATPMYTTLIPAMERYYTKTKDYAKDPGYLQEQLIWDYLLRSPKAGPILRKLIDAGTVRPPEPLPPVPN